MTRTIVYIGDSITEIGGGIAGLNATATSANGYWCWAQFLTGHSLTVLANLGVGGQTSTQIRSRFLDAIALKPDFIHILAGTNDDLATKGIPVGQTIANLSWMIRVAKAKKITPIVGTIPPNNGASAAQLLQYRQVNEWIRSLPTRHRVAFVDYHSVLVNQATGNYAALSPFGNYTTDGVHPVAGGAYAMGKALAAVLTSMGVPYRPSNFSDEADTTNALLYSQFASGSDSSAPTGWNDGTITGGTVAYSRVQRTDVTARKWQRTVLTATTTGGLTYFTRTNVNHRSAAWAVGDDVSGHVEMRLSSMEQGPASASQVGVCLVLQCRDSGGGVLAQASDLYYVPNNAAYYNHPREDRQGVMRTPAVTIPAATAALALQIVVAGAGTYDFDRAGIRNVSRYDFSQYL